MLADKKASAGGSLMRLLNTPSLKENRRTYPQDNSHCGGSAAVVDRYSYPPLLAMKKIWRTQTRPR